MGAKTMAERLQECVRIRQQLKDLGVDVVAFPEILPFIDVMNAYVRDGVSASGSIALPTVKRRLVYVLSNKRACHVVLANAL